MVEMKKVVETKKASEPSIEKIPNRGTAEVPVKRNLAILKRSPQPEDSSINQPSTSGQKNVVDKPELMSQSRFPTPFSLEEELVKLKIPIPLSELMNKDAYCSQVIKALTIEPDIGKKDLSIGSTNHSDMVNLKDDQPELFFRPEVDGQDDNGVVAPFYISLNIHDLILHNAMLDSGASHNLMPKAVMEKLRLEITRPYKDLHSFDSSKVRCIGLIKDLCTTLVQIPAKSMVMDVVVADIPPEYGMFLSQSWGANLRGTLWLDMSYATIPVFGKQRRLYRETLMKYMVNIQEIPHNYPLYSTHSDLDSSILYNNGDTEEQITQLEEDTSGPDEGQEIIEAERKKNVITEELPTYFWSMDFDGEVSKEGARAGIWLHNHELGIQKTILTN
jgi:hypothetical protein